MRRRRRFFGAITTDTSATDPDLVTVDDSTDMDTGTTDYVDVATAGSQGAGLFANGWGGAVVPAADDTDPDNIGDAVMATPDDTDDTGTDTDEDDYTVTDLTDDDDLTGLDASDALPPDTDLSDTSNGFDTPAMVALQTADPAAYAGALAAWEAVNGPVDPSQGLPVTLTVTGDAVDPTTVDVAGVDGDGTAYDADGDPIDGVTATNPDGSPLSGTVPAGAIITATMAPADLTLEPTTMPTPDADVTSQYAAQLAANGLGYIDADGNLYTADGTPAGNLSSLDPNTGLTIAQDWSSGDYPDPELMSQYAAQLAANGLGYIDANGNLYTSDGTPAGGLSSVIGPDGETIQDVWDGTVPGPPADLSGYIDTPDGLTALPVITSEPTDPDTLTDAQTVDSTGTLYDGEGNPIAGVTALNVDGSSVSTTVPEGTLTAVQVVSTTGTGATATGSGGSMKALTVTVAAVLGIAALFELLGKPTR
jgi:hypothetical protein